MDCSCQSLFCPPLSPHFFLFFKPPQTLIFFTLQGNEKTKKEKRKKGGGKKTLIESQNPDFLMLFDFSKNYFLPME